MKRGKRRVRGLWWILLICPGLSIVTAIIWAGWVAPPWLLPDLNDPSLSAADRLKVLGDFRSTLVAMLGGLAVLGGGAVGAVNLVLSQRVQWRAQVTERFTKAIEQLGRRGNENLDVRIGAVYALEQIARDSAELHWPIMEVLTAYLREHSPAKARMGDSLKPRRFPADHQAIATVLGRRNTRHDADGQTLDLSMTDLRGANLVSANLSRAILAGAVLCGADLTEAEFGRADLSGADLSGAFLHRTTMRAANLSAADLRSVDARDADLSLAALSRVNLARGRLERANLFKATLTGADLSNASLMRADLDRTNCDDTTLSGANLSEASLRRATLRNAALREAVGLTAEQVRSASNRDGAALPIGLELQLEHSSDILAGLEHLEGE